MKKFAIIGSGPAGMSFAEVMAKNAHSATVFEARSVLGGAIKTGIPAFRIAPEHLEKRIRQLADLGVVFKPNTMIGKDIPFSSLLAGFDAIFLATGCEEVCRIGIEGENFAGVVFGVNFLEKANLGIPQDLDLSEVIVVGGGNVAMDAARMAARIGSGNVRIFYRRTIPEMPANKKEIEDAVEDGVQIFEKSVLTKIIGAAPSSTPEKNAKTPTIGANVKCGDDEFFQPATCIIPAIGQHTNAVFLRSLGLELDEKGRVLIDEHGQTSIPKVFAGGDVVTGAKTIGSAMTMGRLSANYILEHL